MTAQAIREIGRSDSKDEGGGAWGAGASAAVVGRARALWSALARHKMTFEDSAKLARGRGQWMMTALGDIGEELAPTLAALDLLWVGDVATKDGLRIRSYRELQWAGVTPTGKDTKKWYEVIHALCEDGDETAMLLEKIRTPPMALDVNEFGLCWWTQQELEENQKLRANDGSICPIVRVESTERGIANVSVWSAGGDTTMEPSCRLGNMEGIDIERLVWIEGHTESDGLHAYSNVGYTGQRVRKRMMRKSDIENDFDLLMRLRNDCVRRGSMRTAIATHRRMMATYH